MGISIFKNNTTQQSKDYWERQLKIDDKDKFLQDETNLIDYAKNIDTYNVDLSFFMIQLLRSKIQDAKNTTDLNDNNKKELVELIYNSNLGDYYAKVLVDDLENPISLASVIDDAKNISYNTKAYFSTLLRVAPEDEEKIPYLRSKISLSDNELKRFALDLMYAMHDYPYVHDFNKDR